MTFHFQVHWLLLLRMLVVLVMKTPCFSAEVGLFNRLK